MFNTTFKIGKYHPGFYWQSFTSFQMFEQVLFSVAKKITNDGLLSLGQMRLNAIGAILPDSEIIC